MGREAIRPGGSRTEDDCAVKAVGCSRKGLGGAVPGGCARQALLVTADAACGAYAPDAEHFLRRVARPAWNGDSGARALLRVRLLDSLA